MHFIYRGLCKTGLLINICVIEILKSSNMVNMLWFQNFSGLDLDQNPWFFKGLLQPFSMLIICL